MPQTTIIFGLILIAIGLTAYFGSDLQSNDSDAQNVSADDGTKASDQDNPNKKKRSAITGLAIPSAFGVLLLLSGAIALKESVRKHAMHVAVLVGTLGAVATIGKGSFDLIKLVTGQEVNGRALTFVFLMATACTVFVVLCVRSFINARKQRELEESDSSPANP